MADKRELYKMGCTALASRLNRRNVLSRVRSRDVREREEEEEEEEEKEEKGHT